MNCFAKGHTVKLCTHFQSPVGVNLPGIYKLRVQSLSKPKNSKQDRGYILYLATCNLSLSSSRKDAHRARAVTPPNLLVTGRGT